MSWRDVPMPAAVAALPRDKRGFPVPWVSEWSSGDAEVSVLRVPELGIMQMPMAGCGSVIGEGEPDLGALCTQRQITGMVRRLCDVCGQFIPAGPIYFIGAQHLVDERIGFRECGMHYDCALYSAQVCPALTTKSTYVFEALAYTLRPELMMADKSEPEGVVRNTYASFTDELFLLTCATTPCVLMSINAVPLDSTVMSRSDWVASQTSVSN